MVKSAPNGPALLRLDSSRDPFQPKLFYDSETELRDIFDILLPYID